MDGYRLEEFETHLRSWGAAPTTVTCRLVVSTVIAARYPDPAAVTSRDLAEFLASPGFSAWTRTTYWSHLKSLFAWLRDEGRIEVSPCDRMRRPTPPHNRPRPLNQAEQALVLTAASGDLRAWLLLGTLEGLRAHEVAKIRGEDVTERSLFVLGKGGKPATLPTHPDIWELAQAYPRTGYWFTGRYGTGRGRPNIDRTTVTKVVSQHFDRLCIDGSFHRCRHTYATNLLRAGVNIRVVQTLMRHSSLATTAAYLAVDEDEQQAAIRLLAPACG